MQASIFGIIPPAITPSSISSRSSAAVSCDDEASRVVDVGEQARDVGEVDELLGAERLGDRDRRRVSALML